MPRKQVLFRCDPKLYAAFDNLLKQASPTGTSNVGGELVSFMESVVRGKAPLLQSGPTVNINPQNPANSSASGVILHNGDQEITEPEWEFIRACLRIYRSEFRRPIEENVIFFEIGLSAVEKIAAMRVVGSDRSPADALALSPGERAAFEIASNAQDAADLLAQATRDVTEELRRSRGSDQGTSGGTDEGRKGRPRKARSGG